MGKVVIFCFVTIKIKISSRHSLIIRYSFPYQHCDAMYEKINKSCKFLDIFIKDTHSHLHLSQNPRRFNIIDGMDKMVKIYSEFTILGTYYIFTCYSVLYVVLVFDIILFNDSRTQSACHHDGF